MMGAAGAASGPTYVDDVFSTFLYPGTNALLPINNGINLSGEGGLVWVKSRVNSHDHSLWDTERGNDRYLISNSTAVSDYAGTPSYGLSFNDNGFTVGFNFNNQNVSGANYASWSFRKAPGFFDVVTYTGDTNGTSAQLIPHSLGSVPGMIIVKCTNTGSTNWRVYHRSLGATKAVFLDLTNSENTSIGHWNNTEPTSTHFTVGPSNDVNANGDTYVAYVFAHDDAQFGTNEDESIIKCGTYAGDGSTSTGPTINLGFEPQWLMVKRTDSNDSSNSAYHSWIIQDNMRGLSAPPYTNADGYNKLLFPNKSVPEGKRGNGTGTANTQTQFLITPTGFTVQSGATECNGNGGTYIYMAIRRPNKPPTAGTEVYKAIIGNDANAMSTGFTVDMSLAGKHLANYYNFYAIDRLRGGRLLVTNDKDDEYVEADFNLAFATNDGLNGRQWFNNAAVTNHFFKRTPGFFDVVAYKGTSSARNQDHGLGVAAELIIVKARDGQYNMNWFTGPFTPGYSDGYLYLNTNMADGGNMANGLTSSGSSTFGLTAENDVNGSDYTYVAYLFATLPEISKVGSYSGDTGNTVDVNCGFSAGARFILIKRTDASGDWYLWNHADGIVSGNDPYQLVNDSNNTNQVTNTDYIDPLSSGFTVTSSAPAALNVTGGTYIFLAIA